MTHSPRRGGNRPFALFFALVCAGSMGGPVSSEAVPGDAKVEDLAWLEGTWRMSRGEDEREERWSAPLGDGLVGTFRWLRSSRAWMYEIMTISKDEDRIVFRLKHFDRKLAGWEEKDEALTYPMTKIEPNRVVFENPERDHPRRFVYHQPASDILLVSLEGYKDGKATVEEFRFSRAKP